MQGTNLAEQQKIIIQLRERFSHVEAVSQNELELDITGSQKSAGVMVVFLPKNTQEVAQIVAYCHENTINLVTIGGRTNLVGGTVSDVFSIGIWLKKMNGILSVDKFNRTARVQAGCNTAEFISEVSKHGLCFPQNIASANRSTIGGNIAISSGSPRSLFYGTTKNYVLNLEVVLADGSIIQTGNNVTKESAGYNLTQLIVGSEGTLGVVTEVTFKLVVPPKHSMLLSLAFDSSNALFSAFEKIFVNGFNPVSVEFMDGEGVSLVKKFLSDDTLDSRVKGFLWIEFESNSMEELEAIKKQLYSDLEDSFITNASAFDQDKQLLLKYRQSIGYAVKEVSSFVDVDVAVPRSNVKEFYNRMQKLFAEENLRFTAFAHIGDGNLHINILKEQANGEAWDQKIQSVLDQLYNWATELEGSVSGEHGVGRFYKRFLESAMSVEKFEVLKGIKRLMDNKGILNKDVLF